VHGFLEVTNFIPFKLVPGIGTFFSTFVYGPRPGTLIQSLMLKNPVPLSQPKPV